MGVRPTLWLLSFLSWSSELLLVHGRGLVTPRHHPLSQRTVHSVLWWLLVKQFLLASDSSN